MNALQRIWQIATSPFTARRPPTPSAKREVGRALVSELAAGYTPSTPGAGFWDGANDTPNVSRMIMDVESMVAHPRVTISLGYYKAGIAGAQFELEDASSPEVGQFAMEELERFWTRCRLDAQRAYEYGRGAMELVYEVEDGLLRVKHANAFLATDARVLTARKEYRGFRVRNVEGAHQDYWGPTDWGPAKGFWLAHNRRYSRWYGWPQLYSAWRPWRRLAGRDGAEDIVDGGVYRFAFAPPVGRYPAEDQLPNPSWSPQGTYYTNRDKMREFLELAKAGAPLALSSRRDENGQYVWDVQWPEGSLDVTGLIAYTDNLEKAISLGIGVPPELLEASEVGSGYSGRQIPLEAFLAFQQANLDELFLAWVWQVGVPLCLWNFGPGAWFSIKPKKLLDQHRQQQKEAAQAAAPPGDPDDPNAGQEAGGDPDAPPPNQKKPADDLVEFSTGFDESKHKRGGKGTKEGGRFVAKGGGTATATDGQADAKRPAEGRGPTARQAAGAEREGRLRKAQRAVVDSIVKPVVGRGQAVAARLGNAVWSRMTPKQQAKAKRAWELALAVEHKLNTLKEVSQATVDEVAAEQGLSPTWKAHVSRAVRVADTIASWSANVPGATAALGAAGLPGVAAAVLGKVGYYVPVGSLAYLAYSTARNPFAVIRAARAAIAKRAATAHDDAPPAAQATDSNPVELSTGPAKAKGQPREAVAALAAFLSGGDGDWKLALVLAGLDRADGDLAEAVRLAEGAGDDPGAGPVRLATEILDGDEDDDQAEVAELLAEILYGLYGDRAVEILSTLQLSAWDEAKHPRDARGRFTARGSAEAVAGAKKAVGNAIAGKATKKDAAELVAGLHLLTVKQLREVAAEHGKKVPKLLKAELIEAITALLADDPPEVKAEPDDKEARRLAHEREAAELGLIGPYILAPEDRQELEDLKAAREKRILKPREEARLTALQMAQEMTPDQAKAAVRKMYALAKGFEAGESTDRSREDLEDLKTKVGTGYTDIAYKALEQLPEIAARTRRAGEPKTQPIAETTIAPEKEPASADTISLDDEGPVAGAAALEARAWRTAKQAIAGGTLDADGLVAAVQAGNADASREQAEAMVAKWRTENKLPAAARQVAEALERYDNRGSLPSAGGGLFGGDGLSAREGFAKLPDGARVVIVEGPNRGKTGRLSIIGNMDGSTRKGLILDGETESRPVYPAAVEPLAANQSWRTAAGVGNTARQGGLFTEYVPRAEQLARQAEEMDRDRAASEARKAEAAKAPPPPPEPKPEAKPPASAAKPKKGKTYRADVDGQVSEIARVKAEARKAGVDPGEVTATAKEMFSVEKEYNAQVTKMLGEARAAYKAKTGKSLSRSHKAFDGGDTTQVRGLDLIAREMAGRYPEILGAHGYGESDDETPAAQKLFDLLAAGNPPRRRYADHYREALDLLVGRRAEQEEAPF